MKEWGWHKNIQQCDMQWIVAKGTKRAREGKDTDYFYGETQVTAQKIENFKRRKTAEVPDNMPTPPNVRYNTPSNADSKLHSIEGYAGIVSYSSPLSQMSDLYMEEANIAESLCSQNENTPTVAIEPPAKYKSTLDECLSNKDDPWTPFSLYRLGDYDAILAKHSQKLEQVLEFEACLQVEDSLGELSGIEDLFLIEPYSTMDWEQENSSDALAVDDAFGLSLTLAEYRHKQECSVLEITNSAKHMHQCLLEHFSHENPFLDEGAEATAHLNHGLPLRREGKWTSCAGQLLQDCESAMNSGAHDSQLILRLGSDFIKLFLNVDNESNESDSLVETFRQELRQGLGQNSDFQDILKATRDVAIDQYLLANYPDHCVRPKYLTDTTQFGWLSGAANSAHIDKDLSSTGSLSASVSHKYGLTYSCGEISGISDSIFMAC
ncbi:hypothetical protein VE01_04275 [Pseudogymnoascus verrucosus]|uniref:Uncharacterized protein n=1 Tax=Pseudogymnoascus verrucosus TaxID=342668 RepID=A0A1B8GNG4_9PEZI|nr:uncharacterized protein VE01_04275 [Pseudogymnoascus verrucosus]OBT97382.2 hypothetical protein VE01_04275 [Pseudogymnoascus verrucosus]